ncbi:MAG: ABC transporter substrate-binding protein, partial [Thermomicrobiales bacterium]|nr:ABC transporter substrate-binding protein [Thermomicrobiales bacterium]
MSNSARRSVRRRQVALGLTAGALGLLAAPLATRAQATPTAATPEADAFPVTITHLMGETTLHARPERIVASSDFLNLDALLTLGLAPVAYGRVDPTVDTLLPWQAAAAGIPTFDAPGDVDLEAIAAARPDLILTMPMAFDGWYETVSAIAPTIVLDWDAPWRDSLRLVGRATGASERAAAEIVAAEALL